jgi:hypothetical protein
MIVQNKMTVQNTVLPKYNVHDSLKLTQNNPLNVFELPLIVQLKQISMIFKGLTKL